MSVRTVAVIIALFLTLFLKGPQCEPVNGRKHDYT
jgi:hypothetical protein